MDSNKSLVIINKRRQYLKLDEQKIRLSCEKERIELYLC